MRSVDFVVMCLLCCAGFYSSFYYLTPKLNELGSVIDLCQMVSYYLGFYNNFVVNIRFALVGFIISCFFCSFYSYTFSRTVKDASLPSFCFFVTFLIMCLDGSNFYSGVGELNFVNDLVYRFLIVASVVSLIVMFVFYKLGYGDDDRNLSLKILIVSMIDIMIFFSFKDIGLAIVIGVIISFFIPKNLSDKIWGGS